MIHVLHVITGLGLGGAEAMLFRLLRGLDDQTFKQSVVSLTDRGAYGEAIEADGFRLTTLGLSGMSSALGCFLRLRKAVQEQQPTIIQTWLYHADLFGLLAARSTTNASVVWNIRCAALSPGDVPRSTLGLVALLAKLSTRPNAVVFNSRAGMNAHFALGYRPRNNYVIPNGFDLNEWQPDFLARRRVRDEIGITDNDFLVGMISRYHKLKDHGTFFASASRLLSKYTNVRFLLAGPGIDWNNRQLVKHIDCANLRPHIFLLGPRTDIQTVMPSLDCLVSTSLSEGFPNVLGEAMSCGIPCVTTDAGDSKYIVGDTGWTVPVGDVEAIASAVGELIETSTEERANRSRHCRARIAKTFTLHHVIERYTDLYKNLYARQKQHRP